MIITFLVITFLIIYVPYIIHGGFIVDDWGVVYQKLKFKDFPSMYKGWFPLFSNRPLAPLPITIASLVFYTSALGYIILHLFMWTLFIALTTRVLYSIIGAHSYIFSFFAFFPVLSATVIFSPGMQLVASFSFLLWSVSLTIIHISSKRLPRLAAYALLVMALLTYEIVFPLFFLSWFVANRAQISNKNLRNFILSFMPYVLILSVVAVYQKIIIPQFMVTYSRLNFPGIKDALSILYNWLKTILLDLPTMLFASVSRIQEYNFLQVLPVILVSVLFIYTLKSLNSDNTLEPNRKKNLLFVFISLILFFVSSFLYLLSGSWAEMLGYANRGLTATWVCICILVSAFSFYFQKSKILECILSVFFLLVVCSFVIQRDKQIESVEYQHAILDDFYDTVKSSEHDLSNSYVLAEMPENPPRAFNGEVIFNVTWDFPLAVMMYYPGLVAQTIPTSSQKIESGFHKCTEEALELDYGTSWAFDRIYYYQYSKEKKSSLEYVGAKENAHAILQKISEHRYWEPTGPWSQQRKIFLRSAKKWIMERW